MESIEAKAKRKHAEEYSKGVEAARCIIVAIEAQGFGAVVGPSNKAHNGYREGFNAEVRRWKDSKR
jgi:hypothetical protein